MAKIGLTDTGWSLVPEGWHVFKITAVEYNADFGKVKVEMVTKSGEKHIERYSLLTKSGEVNEGANKAFSYMAKIALDDFDLDEIDTGDLVGCYIKAEVTHVESETVSEKTGKPFINANLGDKQAASGFDDTESTGDEAEAGAETNDIDDFLNED